MKADQIQKLRMAMIARCPVSWLTIEEEAGKEAGGHYKKEGQPAREEPGEGQTGHFLPHRRGSDHIFVD